MAPLVTSQLMLKNICKKVYLQNDFFLAATGFVRVLLLHEIDLLLEGCGF